MSIPTNASQSSQHELTYIPEVVYGVTPTTPAMKALPVTGTTLALSKTKIMSGVIRPDRQVFDVRHGQRQTGGDLQLEFAYGVFDKLLEAVFCGTWNEDFLVPGVVRRSFTFQRRFTDIVQSQVFPGCELNVWNLQIEPNKIMTSTISVTGRERIDGTTGLSGATYAEAPGFGNKAFDSFTGTITVGGQSLAVLTKLDLQLDNGLTPRFVVFQDKPNQPKIGKTMVTGTMTLYFTDATFLQAFNDAEKLDLEFTLVDPAGNSYFFELPSILGTGGQTDVSGDNDITINFPFSSIYEDGEENPNALRITRTPYTP